MSTCEKLLMALWDNRFNSETIKKIGTKAKEEGITDKQMIYCLNTKILNHQPNHIPNQFTIQNLKEFEFKKYIKQLIVQKYFSKQTKKIMIYICIVRCFLLISLDKGQTSILFDEIEILENLLETEPQQQQPQLLKKKIKKKILLPKERIEYLRDALNDVRTFMKKKHDQKWERISREHKSLQRKIENRNLQIIIENLLQKKSSPQILIPLNERYGFDLFMINYLKNLKNPSVENYLLHSKEYILNMKRIVQYFSNLNNVESLDELTELEETIILFSQLSGIDFDRNQESQEGEEEDEGEDEENEEEDQKMDISVSKEEDSVFSNWENVMDIEAVRINQFLDNRMIQNEEEEEEKKNNNNLFIVPESFIPTITFDISISNPSTKMDSVTEIMNYVNQNYKKVLFRNPFLLKDLNINHLSFTYILYTKDGQTVSDNFKKLAMIWKWFQETHKPQYTTILDSNSDSASDSDTEMVDDDDSNIKNRFIDIFSPQISISSSSSSSLSLSSINWNLGNYKNEDWYKQYQEYKIQNQFLYSKNLNTIIHNTITKMKSMIPKLTLNCIQYCPFHQKVFVELFEYLESIQNREIKFYFHKSNPHSYPVSLQKNQSQTIQRFLNQYKTIFESLKLQIFDYRQNAFTGFIEMPKTKFSNDHEKRIRKAIKELIPIRSLEYPKKEEEENRKMKKKNRKSQYEKGRIQKNNNNNDNDYVGSVEEGLYNVKIGNPFFFSF